MSLLFKTLSIGSLFLALAQSAFAAENLESQPFRQTTGTFSLSPKQFTKLGPEATGIRYVHEIAEWHPDKRLYHSSFACGAFALGDVDGDGLVDIYVTGGPRPNRLYLQADALSFVDISTGLSISSPDRWCAGAVMIDIDQDGDLDIYVCSYNQPNQLFVNQLEETGTLNFIEQAEEFGLDIRDASLVPAFADYDRDGDLDLYILTHQLHRAGGRPEEPVPLVPVPGQEMPGMSEPWDRYYKVDEKDEQGLWKYTEAGRPDLLLRNDEGVFVDVSEEAGITQIPRVGNSCAWWDYDQDGWPDLHVGNDFLDPDYLYRNNGDGTFTDVALEVLPRTTWFTMGTVVTDANNDGRSDFLMADMYPRTHYKRKASMATMSVEHDRLARVKSGPRQVMNNGLLVSTGTDRFIEGAYTAGFGTTDWTWSVKAGDYDQDGREDAYFLNGVARNFGHQDLPTIRHEILVGRNHWDVYENTAPERPEQNLAYRNVGDLEYADMSAAWGLDYVAMSHTCSQADLDMDGDLDLVVGSLNEPVQIFRNENRSGTNAIRVRLVGTESNIQGFGSRVVIRTAQGLQQRYLWSSWGFMDSDEASVHFGLGNLESIEELTVHWPSGIVQTFNDLEANQFYTVTESGEPAAPQEREAKETMFRLDDGLAEFGQEEAPFDDQKRQFMTPFFHSQLGPGMAVGDVNGDGNDDIYIGGSRGEPGRLLINETEPGSEPVFRAVSDYNLEQDTDFEDMGALFFDADGDRDLDLYVVSGSVEAEPGDETYQDRLYLNDGSGDFRPAEDALPEATDSGSCVVSADFDRDGDLDLFVGTRVLVGEFPLPANGYILRNDEGVFTDVTAEVAPELLESGLITAAVWSDLDNDGWLDLAVAHDWGPVRILHNDEGVLVDQSTTAGTEMISGWWRGLTVGDLDQDGDMDLVATNLGTNSRFQPNTQSPELIFYGDMDQSGSAEIIQAHFENGVCIPRFGMDQLNRVAPFLKPRTNESFDTFARMNLSQLFGIENLRNAWLVRVSESRHGMFINDGKGVFTFHPLPRITQISPGFGAVIEDFNLDGHNDVYLVQNFSHAQPQIGPLTAGISQLLIRDPKAKDPAEWLKPMGADLSGLIVPGDARSLSVSDVNRDQVPDIIISINDEAPKLYMNRTSVTEDIVPFTISLRGRDGNPLAAGARVQVRSEGMPDQTEEIYQGSGYLSQSSASGTYVRKAGTSRVEVEVRWPDGISVIETLEDPVEKVIIVQEEKAAEETVAEEGN